MKRLSELRTGARARIHSFEKNDVFLKLMEMGCLPGVEIQMGCKAPFKGPVCIHVSGYNLSLRVDEAATIMLR